MVARNWACGKADMSTSHQSYISKSPWISITGSRSGGWLFLSLSDKFNQPMKHRALVPLAGELQVSSHVRHTWQLNCTEAAGPATGCGFWLVWRGILSGMPKEIQVFEYEKRPCIYHMIIRMNSPKWQQGILMPARGDGRRTKQPNETKFIQR